MKEQITVRQTACFCAISLLALKLIALPSLLFEKSSSSGLVVAIVMFVADFLMLFLFLKIKQKYPDCSLYEIIEKFLGKITAKILYLFIFTFFTFKLCMLINEGLSYMQDVVDEDCSLVVFLLTYLPVITALCYGGLKSCARTCEFGFVFILIGFIICLFLSEVSLGFGEIGSLFVEDANNIINACFDLNFWFSDFLFVAILADKIKIEKNMKRKIFSYVIFITFLLMILYFVYFRLFRVTAFLHKTAIADVTEYNRNIGNSGNIDIVSILVYLFVIYFQGSLYMNCLKICYNKIFGYNNIYHFLIATNGVLIFLTYFVFYNIQKITGFVLLYFKYFGVLLWIIIPFIYILLLIFDKEKKYDKKYKKISKKI